MNNSFSVRRAKADDAALIRGMRIASLTEAPYAFGAKLDDVLAQSECEFIETAERHSTSCSSTSFFLFSGADAVGTIGAFFEQEHAKRAFICALWVDPAHRGTSAATLLVATAAEWLKDQGAKAVFAWVADGNARAGAFYKRFGFVTTDEMQPLPSDPSQMETLLCFRTSAG